MGMYADLAVSALKEYLVSLTYSRMFSFAAGQGVEDSTSVESGYTKTRDRVLISLAQALAQVAAETSHTEERGKILSDGQTILNKVKKGQQNRSGGSTQAL